MHYYSRKSGEKVKMGFSVTSDRVENEYYQMKNSGGMFAKNQCAILAI